MKISRKKLQKIIGEELDRALPDLLPDDESDLADRNREYDDDLEAEYYGVLETGDSDYIQENIAKITRQDFRNLIRHQINELILDTSASYLPSEAPEPEDTAVGKRYSSMEKESEEEIDVLNFIKERVKPSSVDNLLKVLADFKSKYGLNFKLFDTAMLHFIHASDAHNEDELA